MLTAEDFESNQIVTDIQNDGIIKINDILKIEAISLNNALMQIIRNDQIKYALSMHVSGDFLQGPFPSPINSTNLSVALLAQGMLFEEISANPNGGGVGSGTTDPHNG